MKFYAIKVGKETGIYNSWEEASPLVQGYNGAVHKSFKSREEAELFLKSEDYSREVVDNAFEIEKLMSELQDNQAIIVTDGSYDKQQKRYGYGIVLLSNRESDEFFNSGNEQIYIESRNVTGEVMGILEGLKICKDKEYTDVFIYYDYEGLEKWANKEWSAIKPISKFYTKQLEEFKDINLNFIKVKSHTGHLYNERADELAKYALKKKGSKTYTDGTVYISGIRADMLNGIIETLEENYSNKNEYLNIQVEDNDFRKIYKVSSLNFKVIISFYNKNKALYIQGKQSELFSEIIENLILFTPSTNLLNERLNEVYHKDIEEDKVLTKMKEIIPNYKISDNQNIDKIIYSAVYNLELNLIKKEYSDLVQPTFRVMEYILHRIINDILGVATDKNGKNDFAYFSKDTQGRYYYNKDKSLLSNNYQVLLDDVYNLYRNNRHDYSHTSLEDEDISTIEDIEIAKDLIRQGLRYFDKYCEEKNKVN
ncbi:ribonuclease H1 domain-containing protein [Macrococcoides caseolyticum]|uniref:ribonuclease H1 domain-containing protein n=1 Tax=Macrococcoides caseolyticum TaxID=69966 RepID=UPI000C3348BB|nr:viroplasmin family protein [Macrococcus caseolyticus]PKE16740.1 hypothetical protein CW718_08160 [Macrococcus caseolyticus]